MPERWRLEAESVNVYTLVFAVSAYPIPFPLKLARHLGRVKRANTR